MSKVLTEDLIASLMKEALGEATTALNNNEVPVGAVLWRNGQVIARCHNQTESLKDVTAHAEVLAVREAQSKEGDWRLDESVLCVTLEPCLMCFGAIELSRISTLIIGASDSTMGACGGRFDLSPFAEKIRIIRDVKSKECAALLKDFFSQRRGD